MAEGAAHTTKPVPGARGPAARQEAARAAGAQRVFSEPGQGAERSVGARSPRASVGIQRDLDRAMAGGAALPAGTQAAMGRAFFADFSAVRVHTGAASDRVAARLGARAMTIGQDIFFRSGAFRPHTPEGDRLLAHELAHVVQQGAGSPHAAIDDGAADPMERLAETAADQAVTAGRVAVKLAGSGREGALASTRSHVIQRSPDDTAPRPSEPKSSEPSGQAASKLDVTSDIPAASETFWALLMGRAMTAYGAWIQDTRDVIRQFVVDVNETADEPATADFGDAILEWIGLIEPGGDIAKAVLITLGAIVEEFKESPSRGLSLAALTERESRVLQKLSDKVLNVQSDLPIYKALRETRDAEKASPAKDASVLQRRRDAAGQLNSGLAALPKPEALRRRLALAWLRQGDSEHADFNDRNEAVEITCFADPLIEGFKVGTRQVGPVEIPDPTRGSFGKFVGYRFEYWQATLLGRAKNKLGMTTALRHAYGDAPLLDLPLRIELTITVISGLPDEPAWRISWQHWGRSWAPQWEAKGDWKTDSFGSEEGYKIFRAALAEARRLRVSDIHFYASKPSREPLD